MKSRIHVITLAVDDLDRAVRFYADGLGLGSPEIAGAEIMGDEIHPAGAVAIFQLHGGLMLCLYPRSDLAKDAEIPLRPPGPGEFSLGHAVRSKEEVDSLLQAAEAAGASLTGPAHNRPWGIYSGYFHDPDGHLWEVIWNPDLEDI